MIEAIATRYGVTYVQLDHLRDADQCRTVLAPLCNGQEMPGFRKVYDPRDAAGNAISYVYQFSPSGP